MKRSWLVAAAPVPLALAVLAAVRPGLLTSGLGSWRAAAVGAGVGLAGLLVLGVLWRRSPLAALWSASVVVLALMAVVIAPGLRERTVVEAFPSTVAPVPPVVASASPAASRAVAPGPVVLARGSLSGIGHDAAGPVVLYRHEGRLVLRFEDLDIQGTPTPVVHLVAAGRRSPSGGVRVGALKAEHGSFGYDLPAGSAPVLVLVWCQRYAVPIAAADLAPVR